MKVKKIFTTLLATTLISQALLPIMQVRAEETPYAENRQAAEAKDTVTVKSEAQVRVTNKNDDGAIDDTEAKAAVDNLFINDAHAILDNKTTQATIDVAKKLVDTLPAGEVKTQLTAEIKKAQDLLEKKNDTYSIAKATEIIDYILRGGVSQIISEINFTEAEHFIGKIKKNTAKKAALSKRLAEGRRQNNYNKELEASVRNLFLTDTTLKSNVTQETIDNLKAKVSGVVNEEWRNSIQQSLDNTERLLSYQNKNKAVKEAVDNLFTTDAHTALKETITQETIDAAKKLVDALPASEVKTQLTAEIKKTQELLDEKNNEELREKVVKEAVNDLFATDAHTALKETKTQAAINAAKKLVDALPTGKVKTQLTAEIKKAQDLLGLVSDSKIDVDDYEMGSSRYVKGIISEKAIKKVTLEINGELKKAISASTGPFQYWAVGQIMSEKDQVFVVGLDAYGNEVKRTKVNIISADSKVNLTASSFVIGKDNYITGTYKGNVITVALRIDGVLTQKIAVKDGVIKYYAKGKVVDSSSKVELVAIDVLGKEMATQTVKVSDVIASMKVNLYKSGEAYIQGTYTGDAKYMAIEVNGRMLQTIRITNGVLKYYGKGKINSVDDKVNIILFDGNKTEIQRTSLKMIATYGTLALDRYKLKASYVTGIVTGDVVKVRLVINGTAQRVISVSNSKFQYYVRNLITKVTDKVIVEGLDAGNNVLDSKTVIVTK